MTEPIFVLGCHRSGTSVVAGLLYHACGVSMGELMPPTEDNPLGYYEALGVVEAHRNILAQLERDWTCPPSTFRPDLLDLSALAEQVEIHNRLPGVWAMKDPRSMFLLDAWSHLGVDRVRLVAVVRPPADTIRSIELRDHIRQDRAEAIVDAYLGRLAEIGEKVALPVIRFPGDADDLIPQVRDLAASLELPWDEDAATDFYDQSLVRHRSSLQSSNPSYEQLLGNARHLDTTPVTSLKSLQLQSSPEWPLETHLAVRFAQQRNQLWDIAHFSTSPHPDVVEILPEGARMGGTKRPGVTLQQIAVKVPTAVGGTLLNEGLRPHGVVANGLLAGRPRSEIDYFFRTVYLSTDPLAELLVDVPDPVGEGLLTASPPPIDHPSPAIVQEIAANCGWDHVVTSRLSPGRAGMFFRKRVLTDSELIPVVNDLIATMQRVQSMERRLATTLHSLEDRGIDTAEPPLAAVEEERERADAAEAELERLRNRRSVRLGLAMARPMRGVFRTVRSWKKSPSSKI